METETALEELNIIDSRFLGFCFSVDSAEDVREYTNQLKRSHPENGHIPVIWFFGNENNGSAGESFGENDLGWDEDGEPPESVGPGMAVQVRQFFSDKKISDLKQDGASKKGLMVGIVRYFGGTLLGITCGKMGGRLGAVYRSILRKTLHRRFFPGIPLEIDLTNPPEEDIYGMGAGDCELMLNVVDDDLPLATADENDGSGDVKEAPPSIVDRLLSELQFDCFKGAVGEELPRLQNLQADTTDGCIPIYRYPGNYSGDNWTTFEWSPTTLQVKQAVEERLKPLRHQTMNHCVTNYYRDGTDFIAHHGDKDLDLNRKGVIVSVSLGDTRVLELRRRAEPRDIYRLILPHGSMLILGPNTNKTWTHAILPKEGSQGVRISLTMRDATTFRDLTTGRLFGAGVDTKTLDEIRTRALLENAACFAAFCGISTSMASKKSLTSGNIALAGTFVLGIFGLRLVSNAMRSKHEERCARDFFSKNSSSGTKY